MFRKTVKTTILAMMVAAAAVSVATAKIPDRPEAIQFRELQFTPPKAGDYRYELSNGVTVYMAPSAEFPLINISFSFKGGEYLEPAGKAGLASMTGQLIREGGTTSIPAKELDEKFDYLAANANAFIGSTFSGANLNCLKSNFDESFGLFMDMVRHPGFDADRFRIAKDEALENMKQRNDNADSILAREWNALVWGRDHFEARVPTKQSIESITQADMRAFHQRIFHPGNLIIAVTGDFNPNDMLSVLDTTLADWPMGEPVADPPGPTNEMKPGVYHVEKDIPQGKFRMGHRGVERDDPDYIPLSIMNDILGGGGFTSRLMKKIRSDEGLTYGIGSGFQTRVWYPGTFQISSFSKNPTVALTMKLAVEEVEEIREEPVSEKELDTAKKSFIETFPRNFESKPGMLNVFVNDQWTNRDPSYWQTYRDKVKAVSVSDVQRVARQYLDPSNLTMLVVGKWEDIYKGDIDGRASMADFFGGEVDHMPLRDPLTQEPMPDTTPKQ